MFIILKKKNIGLIEVMGLAVLPARLLEELGDIQTFLQGKPCTVADVHQQWANDLKEQYGLLTDDSQIQTILEKEIGIKFAKVLGDAGVFKNLDACQRFIDVVNQKVGN